MSAAVLRSILTSAGLDTDGLSKQEMRRLIEVCIRERLARGRRVVIEVDDADCFGPTAWQEVERLQTQARADASVPELLLSLIHIDAGSSPAADYVRAQSAPGLAVLSWLSQRDVSWYLHWRLSRFDLGDIFTPAAVRLIAKCTQGCFASVDHLSQMALLIMRKQEADHVDVMLVREAMRMMSRQARVSHADQEEKPAAELVVTLNGSFVSSIGLGDRLLIGRSPVNDLCLDSAYISRHHATIVRADSGYYLSDLNSVNGVTLNGQKIQMAAIGDGDILCLGPFRLKLRMRAGFLPRSASAEDSAGLADTAIMPAPESPGPAHLKLVR